MPEGFGTGDCVIVRDWTLSAINFKYGVGIVVEAEKNPQMMCYALGALALFDGIYDIDTVSMTMHQKRRGFQERRFFQYSAAWDSKHNVEVEFGKTARLLFSLQEMQDGETKF